MSDQEKKLPLLPLRNTVVFPSTSVFLVVGRKKSIAALKAAQSSNGQIIVSAQKEEVKNQEEIDSNNIYNVGTLCQIRNISGTDQTGYQVLVTGISRFKIAEILPVENFLEAHGMSYPDILNESPPTKALFKNVKHLTKEVLGLLPETEDSIQNLVEQIDKQDDLIYLGASYLKLNVSQMQDFLAEDDISLKLQMIYEQLGREKEVLLLEENIRDKVGKRLTQAQRESLLREQMQAIKEELGETENTAYIDLIKRVEQTKMPTEVATVAQEELKRLKGLHPSSSDYHVIRNYLDWLTKMPWYISTKSKINIDQSEKILEGHHYGLKKIKKRILEHLAVTKLRGGPKGSILCLLGPPGVGKTSLGKSIAEALGKTFVRASLGGIRDESEIRGHRRTYVGSMPGKIIQSIKRAGVNNPLILLDEIDKLVVGAQGDPSSSLLEVLDPEQNQTFVDHYLDVPFDLSQVFFVATANRSDTIPGPLRDRFEIIELSSYTINEKVHIGETFIIPQSLEDSGLKKDEIIIDENIMTLLVENYTREAGVRELKRITSSLCRGAAYEIVKGAPKPIIINQDKVNQYLGPIKFMETQRLRKWIPGMTTGLAWTPVGGDVLYLECLKIPGNGKLKITGQLGDVMKESAELALSFVKSHIQDINSHYHFNDYDIHLHVPAGAIPKDGPSAGITMLVAMASLISEKQVPQDIGMTGELTLTGSVLPIGGLKEKVIAAHRYKIKTILLPKQNEKDLFDIPDEIKRDLELCPIECANQALEMALNIKIKN